MAYPTQFLKKVKKKFKIPFHHPSQQYPFFRLSYKSVDPSAFYFKVENEFIKIPIPTPLKLAFSQCESDGKKKKADTVFRPELLIRLSILIPSTNLLLTLSSAAKYVMFRHLA